MAKSINTKGSNVVVRVALSPKLELIAAQVAGAMQETASLSETLGTLTREAGKLIIKTPDMCDPFVDACRQLCASVGLTEGSFKVYMSNIRGVIRAMVEGYNPKDGQSLRAMYDAAPKGTGRQKVAPRQNDGTKAVAADASNMGEKDGSYERSMIASYGRAEAVIPTQAGSAAERRHAAMIVLFGHADDELDAALTWAASNEMAFTRYVKANVNAVKPVSTPMRKAA